MGLIKHQTRPKNQNTQGKEVIAVTSDQQLAVFFDDEFRLINDWRDLSRHSHAKTRRREENLDGLRGFA